MSRVSDGILGFKFRRTISYMYNPKFPLGWDICGEYEIAFYSIHEYVFLNRSKVNSVKIFT